MDINKLMERYNISHGIENDQVDIDMFKAELAEHIATEKLDTAYEITLKYACMSKWQLLRIDFNEELERMEDELGIWECKL